MIGKRNQLGRGRCRKGGRRIDIKGGSEQIDKKRKER